MKYKFILATLIVLSSFTQLSAQIKQIPYQQLAGATNIFFGASMSSSTITITFAGPSDRWIAIGFGVSMSPCDALIYSNGKIGATHALGWNDYYCGNTSISNVNNDASQDWTVVSTATASGQRTVVATRSLSTGDASDVAFNFLATNLNLVWARGATADYTLAYHGSSNRANGISLAWLMQPAANFTTTNTTVCVGTSVSFSNTTTGGQTTYTWNFQGANLSMSNLTNPSVTYTAPGTYSVVLTASNAIGTSTLAQVNYITVTPTVVPSVNIVQTSGGNPVCSGAPVTFSAAIVNGGPAPVYQWKVNGANSGANSPTFSSTTLPASAAISCVLTANSVCAVPNTATSSVLNVTVNSSAPASVTIGVTGGGNPTCNGTTVTFTATPGNGGTSPGYQWRVNGLPVGVTTQAFSTATLANGSIISCDIASSSTCAVTSTALSNAITMSVNSVLVPAVTFTIGTGSNPMCAGAALSFSASPVNGGPAPTYQWKLNGANVGSNSATFSPLSPAGNSTVSLVMTSNFACASPATATSAAMVLTVNPIPPTPTITPSGTLQLCSGNSLTLSSSAATGNSWTGGSTTQNLVVSTAGVYTVTQSLNNCQSASSAPVTVSVIPSPSPVLVPAGPFCKDDAPAQLQGNPAGGTFSGTAINAGAFSPSLAGAGTFVLTYELTASNGCKGISTATVDVSACTGINARLQNGGKLTVFPNPAVNGELTVDAAGEKIVAYTIYEISGKKMLEGRPGARTVKIDVATINAGVYVVEVQTEAGIYKTRLQLTR